jgi:hypothetical protein
VAVIEKPPEICNLPVGNFIKEIVEPLGVWFAQRPALEDFE